MRRGKVVNASAPGQRRSYRDLENKRARYLSPGSWDHDLWLDSGVRVLFFCGKKMVRLVKYQRKIRLLGGPHG